MGLVTALREALPAPAVVDDPEILRTYARDHAGLSAAGSPAVAVLPRTTGEVAAAVRVAAAHARPVVTRGAGSGLSGGANALDGCVMLLTTRMDRIVALDVDDLTATVQPGVLNGDVAAAAAGHGLWYPPDPASRDFSTIGGNIATNAGGLCCVKYGVTRDFVLALEVVLADGSVARLGRRTVKGVAGYDLVSLFVGSEGTLGIVTEAVLRLRPRQTAPATLVATFDTLPAAGGAIAAVTRATVPAMLEILDRTTLRAVEAHRPMGLEDHAALLIAQSDAGGDAAAAELDAMTRACEEHGASFVAATTDPGEADQLLEARRLAYPALEAQGETVLDDVAVPRARIAELLRRIEEIAEARDLTIGTFGHAGDGNMHPTIVGGGTTPRAAVEAAFADIVEAALALGGTITGEHGVGQLKQPWLATELDPAAARIQRVIKDSLDPSGLLNPGRGIA